MRCVKCDMMRHLTDKQHGTRRLYLTNAEDPMSYAFQNNIPSTDQTTNAELTRYLSDGIKRIRLDMRFHDICT